MSYIVDFGNNRLSDYCSVLNVKRTILPTRSNFQKDIPTLNGSYYTGFKYAEKQIVLEIAIYGKNYKIINSFRCKKSCTINHK